MKKPLVYIIMLNWNSYQVTIECLKSLKKIDYKNYKLVIVDNGSKDNSVKELKKFDSSLQIIENKENLGYSEGCNVGIRYALKFKPDYVMLLNNDIVADSKFIDELVTVAESDPTIGLVGPKIYFESLPDRLWFAGGKMDFTTGKARHIGYLEKDLGQYDEITDSGYVTGCAILIRSSALRELKGLDKGMFMYYEDVDFDYRLKQIGYRTVYAPKSKIWHKVSAASGGEENAFKDYYMTRNPFFFARKRLKYNRKKFYRHFLFDRTQKIMILLAKGEFTRIAAITRGIYHGFSWNIAPEY